MRASDVVVVGAGQAGLAVSSLLTRDGIDHVVLERDAIGARWRTRWDSFTLVTPNWQLRLPGSAYGGPDPDGFLARDDVVTHLEGYAASFDAPVRPGTEVTGVTARPGRGYTVMTSEGPVVASSVVVAVGTFQRPRRPRVGRPSPAVQEVHSSGYRNPAELPPGAVLVVGSGQSGAQIAEELHEAGRQVFLSVGSAPRLPRRYRGRDIMRWAEAIGFYERGLDALETPAERFAPNPHVSGRGGGRTLNLHRFARDGITLAGRIAGIDGTRVRLGSDLRENLVKADSVAAEFCRRIDAHIAEARVGAPEPDESNTDEYRGTDGFEQPVREELDLAREGVTSIVWASGFSFDFSWVRPVARDPFGYPVQRRGVTDSPGLYFVGLHFLDTFKSGLLYGVGEDAAYVAAHIAGRPAGAVTPVA